MKEPLKQNESSMFIYVRNARKTIVVGVRNLAVEIFMASPATFQSPRASASFSIEIGLMIANTHRGYIMLQRYPLWV